MFRMSHRSEFCVLTRFNTTLTFGSVTSLKGFNVGRFGNANHRDLTIRLQCVSKGISTRVSVYRDEPLVSAAV